MADNTELDFATLLDWVEGRLGDAEAEQVARQVENAGQSTRDRLAWIRAFRRVRTEIPNEPLPAATRTLLRDRFADVARRRQPGLLARLFASITFDSLLQPSMSGARGGADAGRRQVIFSSDVADLALNIVSRPADRRVVVSGQVFVKGDALHAPIMVELLADDAPMERSAADELGEFAFAPVLPGVYVVAVRDAGAELLCPAIELQL